jgi:dihydroorotase-like cyclic amidohydrolase
MEGAPPLPMPGSLVALNLINQLRDEEREYVTHVHVMWVTEERALELVAWAKDVLGLPVERKDFPLELKKDASGFVFHTYEFGPVKLFVK